MTQMPTTQSLDEAAVGSGFAFINAIMKQSPNGEAVEVQYHPNGDWSVFDRIDKHLEPLTCYGKDILPFAPPHPANAAPVAIAANIWESVMEWQPIETAPRNYLLILLFNRGESPAEICVGHPYSDDLWRYMSLQNPEYNPAFEYNFDDAGMATIKEVTHWMPLPAPPKDKT